MQSLLFSFTKDHNNSKNMQSRVMVIVFCTSFHQDIVNGSQVTERAHFVTDGRTDRKTEDLDKNNMSLSNTKNTLFRYIQLLINRVLY